MSRVRHTTVFVTLQSFPLSPLDVLNQAIYNYNNYHDNDRIKIPSNALTNNIPSKALKKKIPSNA